MNPLEQGNKESKYHHIPPSRPLVVLVGWLGCKPRHLRDYVSMYNNLGWNVNIKIPSPYMVVTAAITSPKKGVDLDNSSHHDSMSNLAVTTMHEIIASNSSIFIFHLFSNSACFFWETFRDMIFIASIKEGEYTCKTDCGKAIVRQKLSGIVFDSAPANYLHQDLLSGALRFTSFHDRLKLFLFLKARNISLGKAREISLRKKRAMDFWIGMSNCVLSFPQLYIYCENDTLMPHAPLQEIIDTRRHILGSARIFTLKFKNSVHCRHIRIHRVAYETSIFHFVENCLNISNDSGRKKNLSRL